MSLFPETIRTVLAGSKVQVANLVSIHFASQTMRLWKGYDLLRTKDDHRWTPLGDMGAISGIEQAIDGRAPQATMTLSGVNAEVVRLARDEFQAEAKGRLVRAYLQFFGTDDEDDLDNQKPLDLPVPIWAGRMLKPGFELARGEEDQPEEGAVSISVESIFSQRSSPNNSTYTTSDQDARFPGEGDRGFEFVGRSQNEAVTWPDW